MALTPQHISDIALRMRLVEAIFAHAVDGMSNWREAVDDPARALFSHQVRISLAAMNAVAAFPAGDLPAAYTDAELAVVAEHLTAVRNVALRLTQGLATAQTPLLVDEDGNTVKDYTLTQKGDIEAEVLRLHAKVGTILEEVVKPVNSEPAGSGKGA